jgi:hypothetical protein
MAGFTQILVGLILGLSLSACHTCKSSDSPDVCRTKQRDHGQPHADAARGAQPGLVAKGLR